MLLIAIGISFWLSYQSYCYPTTSQYDCDQLADYSTFDWFGFFIKTPLLFVVLGIGFIIGKYEKEGNRL